MRTAKRFGLVGLVLVGALALAGCGLEEEMLKSNNFHDLEKPDGRIARVIGPRDPKNQAPVVEIGVDYVNNGLDGVNYLFTAKDPEGKPIGNINVIFDGDGQVRTYLNGSVVNRSIGSQSSAFAYAEDNRGLMGEAMRTIIPAKEAEARRVIKSDVDRIGYNYISPSYLTIGTSAPLTCQGNLYVDYDLDISGVHPSANSAMVNYISDTDDLTRELSNKQKLDCAGVPNLFMKGIPESEISSRVSKWIDNGFQ